MLPPKLTHGDSLARLFDLWNQLIDYLREIRLVAGNGIRINRLPAGTTIESTATATGGGASAPAAPLYQGMFAVSSERDPDTDNYMLRVKGGVAYVNSTRFDLEDYTAELGTNAKTYVYFSAGYDTSDYTFQNAEIKHYTAPRSDTQYTHYILLGIVSYADQAYSVEQNQYGQIQVLFFGDCGEEENETDLD